MTAKDDARLDHIAPEPSATARLNDLLRTTGTGGTMVATAGIIQLANGALTAITVLVRNFHEFTPDNDPRGEHDFGALTWRGTRIFWKIDCYDRDMRFGSPDPADPAVTLMVLTIMRADEY